ncbi:hypothetical protein HZA97_04730 [Candidatus Woesearchaeota archaeon]|nr:hypothetical protein [Candidatus Woesearchaeota archaeon]
MKVFESKFKVGQSELNIVDEKLHQKVQKELTELEMASRNLDFDKAIKLRNNLGSLFRNE